MFDLGYWNCSLLVNKELNSVIHLGKILFFLTQSKAIENLSLDIR